MKLAGLTVAYWCVLVAALLPIVCAGMAKWGMFGKPGARAATTTTTRAQWLAKQTDWRARANAAQANSFEALPFFIGAVIIAHQLGASQLRLDVLAFALRRAAPALHHDVRGRPGHRAHAGVGAGAGGEHRDPVCLSAEPLHRLAKNPGGTLGTNPLRNGPDAAFRADP